MSAENHRYLTCTAAVFLGLTAFVFNIPAGAQASEASDGRPRIIVGGQVITGIPHDWTHDRVVFSDPGTEEEAFQNGTHDNWLKVVNSPRYILQQLRRRQPARGPHAAEVDKFLAEIRANEAANAKLGATAERGLVFGTAGSDKTAKPPMMPAAESTTLGRVEISLKDLLHEMPVVFPEDIVPDRHELPRPKQTAKGDSAPEITVGLPANAASRFLTNEVELKSPLLNGDYERAGAIQEGELPNDGSLLPAVAITRVPSPSGLWALGSASAMTGAYSLANNVTPLKYSFAINAASCANDFVIYPTGFYGTATQATIVAYNNLYSGCASFHTVYWAYNTGTGSASNLSPVISLDGTQIAFMQYSNASGHPSSLVLLKWKQNASATLANPTAPMVVTNANYRACPTPCMTTIALSHANLDDLSNPFYDYGTDTLWVGDVGNYLHKFTGVFSGTPAEVTTGGFPALLAETGYHVSSPAYDEGTGHVFVGDFYDALYSVTPSTGAYSSVVPGGIVGYGSWDSPLIDSTALAQYFFISSYDVPGYPNACANLSGNCWDAVVEFYPAHPCPPCTYLTIDQVGQAYATNVDTNGTAVVGIYAGSFDNAYYTSANKSSPTGHIYVTANVYGPAYLVQVPIASNVMAAATEGPILGSTKLNSLFTSWGATSPVTEFYNSTAGAGGVDYLFFSTNDGYNPFKICSTNSPAGCVVSYNAANFPAAVTVADTMTAQAFSNAAPSGTFIIDNNVPSGTLAGASQTYFLETYGGAGITNACTTSGKYPCAVQASQASVH